VLARMLGDSQYQPSLLQRGLPGFPSAAPTRPKPPSEMTSSGQAGPRWRQATQQPTSRLGGSGGCHVQAAEDGIAIAGDA
jgi:hypothetical protein